MTSEDLEFDLSVVSLLCVIYWNVCDWIETYKILTLASIYK